MAGLLSSGLMGPAQRLLAPAAASAPVLAQAAAPRAGGGLLEMFAPQMAQSQGYQAFDQRRNALANMFLGGVGAESPLERMRGMAQGVMQGRQADAEQRQINETAAWLSKKFGLGADEALVAVRSPEILKYYMKAKGGADMPANVQEWEYFNNLTPDEQGKYLRMKRSNPYLDVGTGYVQPDPVNPGGTSGPAIVKKNYQEKFDQASGTEDAKAAAARRAQAPQAIATANQTLGLINQLRNHPGRSAGTGRDYFRGSIPATDAYDFARLNDQLAGKAFLEAFESLKGGGQITEIEGRKATEAIARLDRAQTEEGYMQALADLEAIVQIGLARAQQGIAAEPSAPQAVQPGGGGYRILSVE